MLTIKKNGREVLAMVMDEPYNGVFGVAQCNIIGCGAQMALTAADGGPLAQIAWFVENHPCDPGRLPAGKA